MVQILSVVIGALGLIVVILGGMLRYVMTNVRNDATVNERLTHLMKSIETIGQQIQADRSVTNERLTYLERHVWNR